MKLPIALAALFVTLTILTSTNAGGYILKSIGINTSGPHGPPAAAMTTINRNGENR